MPLAICISYSFTFSHQITFFLWFNIYVRCKNIMQILFFSSALIIAFWVKYLLRFFKPIMSIFFSYHHQNNIIIKLSLMFCSWVCLFKQTPASGTLCWVMLGCNYWFQAARDSKYHPGQLIKICCVGSGGQRKFRLFLLENLWSDHLQPRHYSSQC